MQTESLALIRDGQEQLKGQNRKRQNNNHHVVPLGILIVLSTSYLLIAGLQLNYNYYFRSGVDAAKISESKSNEDSQQFNDFQPIESSDLCSKMDIFTMEEANDSISQPPNKRIKLQSKSTEAPGTVAGKSLKSIKAWEGNRKKDNAKKTNTAEPIIYLFALVFIYLLLKAASDINQHYKSNKGDKRLRRCSLQSYAQKDQRNSHQDRRASKEARSMSLDRYRYNNAVVPHKLRKQITSVDPLRTYQALGNLANPIAAEPRQSRRLSVPISINYQIVNVSSTVHPELTRRGSVISLGSSGDMSIIPGTSSLPYAQNTMTPDIKRRVRMINRH